MRKIDLHVHTTASDGSYSPALAVVMAKESGLAAVAITDHDTTGGYLEARDRAAELGVELVPGIEISTKFGVAVHILGYYIDPESKPLTQVLDWVVEDRDKRNRAVAELMAADGLPVSYDMMRQRFGEVIGRPHFAELLVELGKAASIKDAFQRYVEKGQRYYLPRTILGIERAIETVTAAGGVAVLAHPFQYRMDDLKLRELIEYCMAHGLRGMECRYSGYSEQQEEYLEALAGEYGLLKTGGSDCHGEIKPNIRLGVTGSLDTPYQWLAELKEAADK